MGDYPTNDELKTIETWEFKDSKDLHNLLAYIRNRWWMPDWGWRQKKNKYWISTAGWSGNEDIMESMKRNFMFWMTCWKTHRVGGHYTFTVPRIAKEKKHGRHSKD